jgi:hypothetical protein
MKIKKQELYDLYMKEITDIAEECDWVTHFGPEEIVNIIANILEKNSYLIEQ